MTSPDALPLWFFIPAFIVTTVTWFAIEIRHAKPDPDPQWSQLDCWDGLDSRID